MRADLETYSVGSPSAARKVYFTHHAANLTSSLDRSFILSLQRRVPRPRRESHQRSWWIVHTQPAETRAAPPSRIPPTQLVDRSYSPTETRAAPPSRIPPTTLVERSYSAGQDASSAPVSK